MPIDKDLTTTEINDAREINSLLNRYPDAVANENAREVKSLLNRYPDTVANENAREIQSLLNRYPPPTEPDVIATDIKGNVICDDMRVKIRIPSNYFIGKGQYLSSLGGIVFPYTPNIQYEYKADYSPASVIHSNFDINFYKKSSISDINIVGKFTVENDNDALMYLATFHVLKALTKMRSGGATAGDADSGAPPPVCRLDAYGDNMFKNAPVVIKSFRVDLKDDVDYYKFKDLEEGGAFLPTSSQFTVGCLLMYSRDEMQSFGVTKYLSDRTFTNRGYI